MSGNRKQYKIKRRGGCALCHPNKHGWECRWSPKENARRQEWQRASRAWLGILPVPVDDRWAQVGEDYSDDQQNGQPSTNHDQRRQDDTP